MKKVITYGTFDMFHEGHYNILKRAKEYGDYLIVAVTGENYDIGRGKLSVRDSLATRMENVQASGFADEIIVEEYLGQKIGDIIKYGVDVFVIGDDWRGKFDLISEYCQLVYLPRTEGISSTQIREETFDKHKIGIIADRCDDNTLVADATKVSGFKVTGFYAEDVDLTEEFSAKYGVEDVTTNFEYFLKTVDTVYINTDLRDRYRFIKACLEAGKHVISDAPFTIDVDREKELLDLASEKGLILMHNLKNLHTTVFNQLLWNAKAGVIGDVVRIDCSASKNDRRLKQRFYELTSSALSTVLNIMGTDYGTISKRVIRASDMNKSIAPEDDSIEYMSMTIPYLNEDGSPKTEVIINIGNNIRVGNKIEIVGTKGTIRLGNNWWRADAFELLPIDADQSKLFHVNYDGNGFKFIIKDMAIMMKENRVKYGLMKDELDLKITELLQNI